MPKKPVTAAILNLMIPGLGCAYAGSWFYAIFFFIWVPLAHLASLFVSSFLAGLTAFIFQNMTVRAPAFWVIELLIVFRIMYEQATMPYEMLVSQLNGSG
jgi:hypothetical protein